MASSEDLQIYICELVTRDAVHKEMFESPDLAKLSARVRDLILQPAPSHFYGRDALVSVLNPCGLGGHRPTGCPVGSRSGGDTAAKNVMLGL